MQYLLTSPECKGKLDIHMKKDLGARVALGSGNLTVLRYLLTSHELIENVKPKALTQVELVYFVTSYFRNEPEQRKLIDYALYDLDIKITPQMVKKIYNNKTHVNFPEQKEFLKMVGKRDIFVNFNKKLNQLLPDKKATIKLKI